MKKNTFYAIAFIFTLSACAVVESTGDNSQILAEKQQSSVLSTYQENKPKTDEEISQYLQAINPEATPEEIESLTFGGMAYEIVINEDQILVVDPETQKIILSESLDSNSEMSKAILKDNE